VVAELPHGLVIDDRARFRTRRPWSAHEQVIILILPTDNATARDRALVTELPCAVGVAPSPMNVCARDARGSKPRTSL
jgi:hypothetical protein